MATNDDIRNAPGCGGPLKGCLIIAAIVAGLLLAGLIYVSRMPGVGELAACKENMTQVAGAISRYEDVNGRPPPNLEVLAKKYLRDPSVLRCPSDTSPGDKPSYTYFPNAKGKQVMLEYDKERFAGQRMSLRVAADGTFSVVPISKTENKRRP